MRGLLLLASVAARRCAYPRYRRRHALNSRRLEDAFHWFKVIVPTHWASDRRKRRTYLYQLLPDFLTVRSRSDPCCEALATGIAGVARGVGSIMRALSGF